jgi:hypothetical protein
MNTIRSSSTSTSTRFVTSRAQLSPLGRRTGGRATASKGAAALSVPRTVTLRSTDLVAPALTAAESFAFPSFWTSGALDRLQPEVTRYHE